MEKESYLHSLEAVPLSEIVKEEYRNYQIYTLMDRAIPYLEDGLKPVQRRILYTLYRNQSKGLMKVSSATGLVLTLHPHGPQSIESAIVNMAQDFTFSNNYPLIDKKGYFGERMEPMPAASRYIECKIGKVAEILLFDDLNQVEMIPNYDEKVMEPVHLFPKLPLMLLNGSEGIGTGFSSNIPSFRHEDVVDAMVHYVKTGKTKRLKPWVRYFDQDIEVDDNGKLIFNSRIEKKGEKFFITELPRGHDAKKIYTTLTRLVEKDVIKDFIDSTVDNDVSIELVFKKGRKPQSLSDLAQKLNIKSSLTPNYTLISERGVKIYNKPFEIVKLFTDRRLEIVKIRYQLLAEDYQTRINQNNEIIRFIKDKHYAQAIKEKNRKTFVDYLAKKKFKFTDYLADMPIYRMTKEEVAKRQLLVKEGTIKLKECRKIVRSHALVKTKLIEELLDVKKQLGDLFIAREKEREKLRQQMEKKGAASKKKKRSTSSRKR